MKPHKPADRNGKALAAGDIVRIVGLPDLYGMSKDGVAESLPIFQYLLGKYKRITGFDAYGYAEFTFFIKSADGKRSLHSVGIEPFLLHKPQTRS